MLASGSLAIALPTTWSRQQAGEVGFCPRPRHRWFSCDPQSRLRRWTSSGPPRNRSKSRGSSRSSSSSDSTLLWRRPPAQSLLRRTCFPSTIVSFFQHELRIDPFVKLGKITLTIPCRPTLEPKNTDQGLDPVLTEILGISAFNARYGQGQKRN